MFLSPILVGSPWNNDASMKYVTDSSCLVKGFRFVTETGTTVSSFPLTGFILIIASLIVGFSFGSLGDISDIVMVTISQSYGL